jgi:hypothetical protein
LGIIATCPQRKLKLCELKVTNEKRRTNLIGENYYINELFQTIILLSILFVIVPP